MSKIMVFTDLFTFSDGAPLPVCISDIMAYYEKHSLPSNIVIFELSLS